MNRKSEAAERFAERRRQEDEAPRLRDVVPTLVSCRLEIKERRAAATIADVSHTRHVVVARAPALFLVPCSDPSCREGGYDISRELIRALRDRKSVFEGEDTCNGNIGSAHCGRVLTFTARAEYTPAP